MVIRFPAFEVFCCGFLDDISRLLVCVFLSFSKTWIKTHLFCFKVDTWGVYTPEEASGDSQTPGTRGTDNYEPPDMGSWNQT